MNLPRLYKQTKTGATQICDISYSGDQFHVTFGQLDGKLQTKSTTCVSTNVGRSNERSPTQQAEFEASAKHTLKAKSGYSTSLDAPSTVQLPQKVKTYVGNENKIIFPAYSTPKLNGINGTYWLLPDGTLKLTSRGGLEYPPIPHLEDGVRYLMSMFSTDCLNGELYIHGEHLQDITSAVKKPNALSSSLAFHVFDMPNLGVPYYERAVWLGVMNRVPQPGADPYHTSYYANKYVTTVQPVCVASYEDIETHYNQCMAQGFEGTVISNSNAMYKFNERSTSVYKYKKAIDAEFQVIAYEFDKNKHVVYTCKTLKGNQFKVKRKGTNAERTLDAQQASDNLDKWLTIEFEVYSKDEVPLKGVGLYFRDCNELGEPNE